MQEFYQIKFDRRFTSSLKLGHHPVSQTSFHFRNAYFQMLSYLLAEKLPNEITAQRLMQYRLCLMGIDTPDPSHNSRCSMRTAINHHIWIGKSNYVLYLLLDAALILDNPEDIGHVYECMCHNLYRINRKRLKTVYQALLGQNLNPVLDPYAKSQLFQFRENQVHKQKKILRIAVTATMSSGKSTFINAIIGDRLARSSQEACTGNITCFFNKAFDDHSVHLLTNQLTLGATKEDLASVSWEKPPYIAVYFQSAFADQYQVCLIDMPGVDSVIHTEHGEITRSFLKSDAYDKVVYILSADKAGAKEEINYLKWIYQNISREKVIFVLNKVDTFRGDDSISESIQGVQKDLMEIGFSSPVVYPVSAYIALLYKMKYSSRTLSRRELRDLDRFEQDLQMSDSSMSGYGNDACTEVESEMVYHQKQCGLYDIEQQLFGTQSQKFHEYIVPDQALCMKDTGIYLTKPEKGNPPRIREGPEAMHYQNPYRETNTKQIEFGGNEAMEKSGTTSVQIMYNPYTLDTVVKVDGKKLAENSKLRNRIAQTSHLQEWIEELPELLKDEYNTHSFDILFFGTEMDYYDVREVLCRATKKGFFQPRLAWEPAKETKDKEKLIDQVFHEIQQGPFPELKSKQFISAYTNARNGVFNVCVVATMSAGKSTFINALLGEKLMPSKQEACTAIITTIQDKQDARPGRWRARALDSAGKVIETQNDLTYENMQRFNDDRDGKGVAKVEVTGKIPFVQSDDVSLVLVDTPGPNNARCESHEKVQREYLKNNANSVVLFILDPAYGKTDEKKLLEEIAESMKTGGKQSRDRYIFVLNKLDERTTDDGSLEPTLKKVREWLGKFGIKNPNVYPAAALPAMNIRLLNSGKLRENRDIRDANNSILNFNEGENLHFEQYAPLPQSIKDRIANKLETSNESQKALIHTGVVSIEAAIRLYVQKYAKTMKIRDLVDTFHKQFELSGGSEKYISELMQSISGDQQERKRIQEKCKLIERNILDGRCATQFRDRVDTTVDAVKEQVLLAAKREKSECQKKLREDIEYLQGDGELSVQEAQEAVDRWNDLSDELFSQLQSDIQMLLEDRLIDTANKLLEEYKEKLCSMAGFLDSGQLMDISVDPFRLIGVEKNDFQIDALVHNVQVEAGQEWVENTNKKWYKPWTWFQEKGFYRKIFKTEQRISNVDLQQAYLGSTEIALHKVIDDFAKFAKEQLDKIRTLYTEEFDRLDGVLKDKLKDLQDATTNEQAVAERILLAQSKCDWLKEIVEKVNSILEI